MVVSVDVIVVFGDVIVVFVEFIVVSVDVIETRAADDTEIGRAHV